jgi:hypothetical protein
MIDEFQQKILDKMRKHPKPTPIEVWLTQKNMTVTCRAFGEDETLAWEPEVDSLTLRGAQREMTSWFGDRGYEPVGRWVDEQEDVAECSRKFKLKAVAA